MVVTLRAQLIEYVFNLVEVVEALSLLLRSPSISDGQKETWTALRDQLPYFISTTKSALQAEEVNAYKLEKRK